MARGPLAAPGAQDPELEDEVQNEGTEGQDDGRQEGEDGAEEGDDAALDTGAEQETGGEEDLAPSRGENRFQRLSNENAELKRRLTDLERRPPQTFQPQVQQEETEEQFRARMQLLPPDERMEARLERSERINQRRMAHMAMQSQDFADKAAYDAKAAYDGRFKRYAADVEAKRAELISQGQVVPREALLKYLIGERVLANQGTKEVKQQRAQSEKRVQRQQVKPAGTRGDVAGSRRATSEADARARRLEDLQI